jgi:hypothetical protein
VKRIAILMSIVLMTGAGCGSGDAAVGDSTAPAAGEAGQSAPARGSEADAPESDLDIAGAVVDLQPPGQASISVDGIELTLDEPGGTGCSIGENEFGCSFRTAVNAITLGGGGASSEGDGWNGAIRLVVGDPYTEYVVDLTQFGESHLAFSGSSMSYEGPWVKGAGEDAGTGTISVTCP